MSRLAAHASHLAPKHMHPQKSQVYARMQVGGMCVASTAKHTVSTASLAHVCGTKDVRLAAHASHLAPKHTPKKSPNFTQRTEGPRLMRKIWDFF